MLIRMLFDVILGIDKKNKKQKQKQRCDKHQIIIRLMGYQSGFVQSLEISKNVYFS